MEHIITFNENLKLKDNKKSKDFTEFNENTNTYNSKIILEKLDPMGNVIDTIELDGCWKITTNNKSYFMTKNYIDEIKVDSEKIQKNFIDNL